MIAWVNCLRILARAQLRSQRVCSPKCRILTHQAPESDSPGWLLSCACACVREALWMGGEFVGVPPGITSEGVYIKESLEV